MYYRLINVATSPLCYVMVGCCAVPCPKNFSAQSDPVSFCASGNKRLVTCQYITATQNKKSELPNNFVVELIHF